MINLFCRYCNKEVEAVITDKVFENGTLHKQADCVECGLYIKYIADETKPAVLYFGKYKGKTMEWVAESDRDYLIWLGDQDIKNRLKEQIRNALTNSTVKEKPQIIMPAEEVPQKSLWQELYGEGK